MPTNLKIFICHSSLDKAAARVLYHHLIQDGFYPWLDEEKLLPGQFWKEEISKAVKDSDAIIICLSNNSITKEGYIQKEIKFALDVADEKPEGTIFIIPAKVEECNIPSRLNDIQWVNLFFDKNKFDPKGYEKLLQALATKAKMLQNNTVILQSLARTRIQKLCNTLLSLSEQQRKIVIEIAKWYRIKYDDLQETFKAIPRNEFSYRIKDLIAINLVSMHTEVKTDGATTFLGFTANNVSKDDFRLLIRLLEEPSLNTSSVEIAELHEVLIQKSYDENPETTDKLKSLSACQISWVRELIARKSNLPAEILLQFSYDEDQEVRKVIAEKPDLPKEILEHLSSDDISEVRRVVAKRSSLPAEILLQFSHDKDKEVRKIIAEKLDLPKEILERLSSDNISEVRRAIAKKSNLPDEILVQFSQDKDEEVRKIIAEKPDIFQEIFEQLAKDLNDKVLIALLSNDNCPENILMTFAKNENFKFRHSISKRNKLPQEIRNILAEYTSPILEKHQFVNGICSRCGCRPEFVEHFQTNCID